MEEGLGELDSYIADCLSEAADRVKEERERKSGLLR